jgi:hypothetical protein
MDTAPDGVPATFTSVQLRWLLGLSNSRLEQLMTAGVITRIEKGSYTANSIRRYVEFLRTAQEGPRDWQAARVELAREKLALLRLERGQKEGELLAKGDVKAMGVSIMRTVQARLLAVAPATAPRLLALHRPMEAEAIVRDAITAALTELANLARPPEGEASTRGSRRGRQ